MSTSKILTVQDIIDSPAWKAKRAAMMDDLWNALHDSEHGHPASPSPPAQCWRDMLDHVRVIRQQRWEMRVETGRLIVND